MGTACGVLFAALLASTGAPASADDLLSRFLKEAPAGWERWHQQMLSSEVRFRDTQQLLFKSPPELDRDQTYHFHLGHGSSRYTFTKPLPNGTQAELVGVRRGSQYRFEAARSQNGQLALKDVVEHPKPSDNPLHPALSRPYTMEHIDWREWVVDPQFHPSRTDIVRDTHGKELVRVHFTYDNNFSSSDGGTHRRIEEGFADFRPDLNWALQHYEIVVARKRKLPDWSDREKSPLHGDRDYGVPQNGFIPINRSVRSHVATDSKEVRVQETLDYEICRPCTEPSSFFSFEAVGLPDVTRRNRIDWYWLGLVNVVVLLVVAVVWRNRRRST